jgi:hypothetical protein
MSVRSATLADVYSMAPRLREADKSEIRAATGRDPLASLRDGLARSRSCKVGLTPEGEPAVIWGVVPIDPMVGGVWALATDQLSKHKIQFLRGSREHLEEMQKQFPLLMNVVDARNTLHIDWLKWLGFTFIAEHPSWGVEQRLFYEFVRIRDV